MRSDRSDLAAHSRHLDGTARAVRGESRKSASGRGRDDRRSFDPDRMRQRTPR